MASTTSECSDCSGSAAIVSVLAAAVILAAIAALLYSARVPVYTSRVPVYTSRVSSRANEPFIALPPSSSDDSLPAPRSPCHGGTCNRHMSGATYSSVHGKDAHTNNSQLFAAPVRMKDGMNVANGVVKVGGAVRIGPLDVNTQAKELLDMSQKVQELRARVDRVTV